VYSGIFMPDIDKILWSKHSMKDPGKLKYLVKYKGSSYLHVEWIFEESILERKTGKNKLNRF